MPELPEVETVKEGLKLKVVGKVIRDVIINYDNIIEYPDISSFCNNIRGQKINDIDRYGKWLIFVLDNYYLLSHLRMEGKYFIKNFDDEVLKHEHVIFKFDDSELRYMDVRKFGKMLLVEKDKINEVGPFKDMGLEPWDKKLTVKYLRDKFSKKKLPIKSVLLDQGIIVGIGNIYADEILFLSGINPMKCCSLLSDKELSNIIKYTKFELDMAIKKGGTTIRSYSSVDGVHGLFQQELKVHTKSVCPNCGSDIKKIRVGGRGTYYCYNCQREG